MSKTVIQVKVIRNENYHINAIVRKKIIATDGKILMKFALSHNGEWIPIEEGQDAPKQCLFPFSQPKLNCGSPCFMRSHTWYFEANKLINDNIS